MKMFLQTISIVCFSFAIIHQSLGQLTQRLGQLEESAAQFAKQTTKRIAKASDFSRFVDKSKELQRNFTTSEVSKCTGPNGGCLYIIYDGEVLDLTDFVDFHSGGSAVLLKYAGRDATEAMRSAGMPLQVFDVFIQRFLIGRLVPESSSALLPRARKSCSWFVNSMGLCDYILITSCYDEYGSYINKVVTNMGKELTYAVKIEKIHKDYSGFITRIFLQTNTAFQEILNLLQLNNVTREIL